MSAPWLVRVTDDGATAAGKAAAAPPAGPTPAGSPTGSPAGSPATKPAGAEPNGTPPPSKPPAAAKSPPPPAVRRTDLPVAITEVMYNPASDEGKGEAEWVEIANLGSATVEIKDWRLDDEDHLPFDEWGPFSCTLAPGAVAVLVNAAYVDEAQFRQAWDAAGEPSIPPLAPGTAGTGTSSTGTSGTGTSSTGTPGAGAASAPPAFVVIAVKWGGLSNSPDATNEILQLRDAAGAVVCEANLRNGDGGWPKIPSAGGPSVYLAELLVESGPGWTGELNAGSRWRAATLGFDLVRECRATAVFNGRDLGSPGQLPERLRTESQRLGVPSPTAPVQAAPPPPRPPHDGVATEPLSSLPPAGRDSIRAGAAPGGR